MEPSAARYCLVVRLTPTSPSDFAPQRPSISRVSCCITIPAPRSESICELRSKMFTSQPIRRSSIPAARPVREPPTIVARFIHYSPSHRADAVLAVARRSQNLPYGAREQVFFLGTVGNECPLKRDLR